MKPPVGTLARRILFAPVVVVAVAVVIYGGLRILRPDLYPPGDSLPGGIVHDLDRALLHLDLGCAPPGGTGSSARPSGTCMPVRVLWQRGMAADIWLLAGSIVVGGVGGVLGGLWCVRHPRTLLARALQTGAALAYCAPVYVVGLALLYLFNPVLGIVHVPLFFDAVPRWASPFTDPWTWLRTLLVPWLVLAAPLAGMCLRLTLATAREITQEDYVRTAVAKGLTTNRVVRHHIGRPTFGATVSFAPVTLPLFLTNVMLVERLFSVPGFFHNVWDAIGHNGESAINLPIIIAAALWTTVLLIVLGMLADAILGMVDPLVRGTAF
ncbi:MAG: peptide/nickel transport system permease protein [Solirubrobacteraceae bacterium]|jgi:peptide/nickel transport system permease protein|nr:peptide/nickel transport system permease protein [Solirubrobacteraceae bacterium]